MATLKGQMATHNYFTDFSKVFFDIWFGILTSKINFNPTSDVLFELDQSVDTNVKRAISYFFTFGVFL